MSRNRRRADQVQSCPTVGGHRSAAGHQLRPDRVVPAAAACDDAEPAAQPTDAADIAAFIMALKKSPLRLTVLQDEVHRPRRPSPTSCCRTIPVARYATPCSTRRLSRAVKAAGSSGNSPSRICACSSSSSDRSAIDVRVRGRLRDRADQRMPQVDLQDRRRPGAARLLRQQPFQFAIRTVTAGDQAGGAGGQPCRGLHVGDAFAEARLDARDRLGLVGGGLRLVLVVVLGMLLEQRNRDRNRCRPGSMTSAACRRSRAAPRSRTHRPASVRSSTSMPRALAPLRAVDWTSAARCCRRPGNRSRSGSA